MEPKIHTVTPSTNPAEVVIRVVFETAPTTFPMPNSTPAPPIPKPTPVLVPRMPPLPIKKEDNLFGLWTKNDTPAAVEVPLSTTEPPAAPPPTKKFPQLRAGIANALYYSFLVLIVMVAFLIGGSDPTGPPRDIFGYSFMTVLTRSMQDTLPQDSLIITRRVDPETIRIGDDIAFIRQDRIPVVHRVVDVSPTYQNTFRPGFQTQGTMNPSPDPDMVAADNVIGLVIFNSLLLGNVIQFAQQNAMRIMLFVIFGSFAVFLIKKLLFWEGARKAANPPTLRTSAV